MQTRIIRGKAIAAQIQKEAAAEVCQLKEKGLTPGLATVLVGDNPASQVYVSNKAKTCQKLGMYSRFVKLPAETTAEQLLDQIGKLNRDDSIDGILVQLPLPYQLESETVLKAVHPAKDVDGFHPLNVGKLTLGQPGLVPCTPLGILELLKRESVPLKGAHAVIVGRSNIVGKPLAHLLLREHCTVTICHSRTRRLDEVTRQADVLIAAVGRPALLGARHIQEGAVVVDVGINRLTDPAEVAHLFGSQSARLASLKKRGSVLVGDVHPREPLGLASAVTPVPGGVGPLTIALLMKNTIQACRLRRADNPRLPRKARSLEATP